jgi:hypothetical protein
MMRFTNTEKLPMANKSINVWFAVDNLWRIHQEKMLKKDRSVQNAGPGCIFIEKKIICSDLGALHTRGAKPI